MSINEGLMIILYELKNHFRQTDNKHNRIMGNLIEVFTSPFKRGREVILGYQSFIILKLQEHSKNSLS
jgi:hypothetical protein